MKPFDYMSAQEIEDVRAYRRLAKAKRTEEVTPEMKAAWVCLEMTLLLKESKDASTGALYTSASATDGSVL